MKMREVTPSTADTRPTRWVSCSQELDWATSRYRHLTHEMRNDRWVTTFCGATGSPGSMRGNSRKPKCPHCQGRAS
jgi:NADH pyrophosphatase NudC (nudix superfamily)